MHNAYSHAVSSCDLVRTYKRSGSVLEWQGFKSSTSKSYTAEARGDPSQGDALGSVALCRLDLVVQASRQSMPSKDHQSYKAEQSLTEGQGKFPPEYCGLLQGGAVLPWGWKPTLPDSL